MIGQRLLMGVVSGMLALVPLGLIAVLTATMLLDSMTAAPLALLALALAPVILGLLAGYLAGRGRRKRREMKAVVGATSGLAGAIIFGAALEGAQVLRAALNPTPLLDDPLALHPIRVAAAIILLCTVGVAIAMLTCHFTARPLPPPRNSRRLTTELPAVPQPRR